jgi:hypothetical protein
MFLPIVFRPVRGLSLAVSASYFRSADNAGRPAQANRALIPLLYLAVFDFLCVAASNRIHDEL